VNATLALAIFSLACYAILIWVALFRSMIQTRLKNWLLGALLAAGVGAGVFLLPRGQLLLQYLSTDALRVLGMSLTMLAVSSLTLVYLGRGYEKAWTGVGGLWLALLVALTLRDPQQIIGVEGWLSGIFAPLNLAGVLVLGGWAVIGAVALAQTFYTFFNAHLPEEANRAIFWALTLPLVLVGALFASTGSSGLVELGLLVSLAGVLGAGYAALRLRVLDVRQNLRRALVAVLLTLIAGVIIFVVLAVLILSDIQGRTMQFVVAALLATLAAAPLVVLLNGFSRLVAQSSGENLAEGLGSFSEAVSGVVDLNELVAVTLNHLGEMLHVQRAGLLFTEQIEQAVLLKPQSLFRGEIPQIEGRLATQSPIHQWLLKERKPLPQFDIEYNPIFESAPAEEKLFFHHLHMAAYAPVVAQGEVIGILCASTKARDDHYTAQDLLLLATVANQAGIALRNARLVDDLRRREKEAVSANAELKETKERLEQLDGVKTDFITIASHELRTPLAQVRGYTDIIEALNEQGLLDPEQLTGMTSNLRKATDRMEELIRNMLDVSQLDVNAMDLRFSPVKVDNVVKMAIEPLTEAIRNRKLTLSARGLRGLPELEGDMKRLVQAFQNVIVNAVKFTPDGGRIDISGKVERNPETHKDEIVIEVKDSGIGIEPKNAEIIFEKFVRTQDPNLHSTGKTKFMGAGPGLGLTIARGVIDGHGGRIWAESTRYDPDALPGSTFYIVLPVKPPEDATGVLHFERGTVTSVHDREKLLEALQQADAKT